jgi:hypothetical protein
MPPVEFEPTILAGERPQTHALDRAATGIGKYKALQHGNSTKCLTGVESAEKIVLHYHTI